MIASGWVEKPFNFEVFPFNTKSKSCLSDSFLPKISNVILKPQFLKSEQPTAVFPLIRLCSLHFGHFVSSRDCNSFFCAGSLFSSPSLLPFLLPEGNYFPFSVHHFFSEFCHHLNQFFFEKIGFILSFFQFYEVWIPILRSVPGFLTVRLRWYRSAGFRFG